MNRLEERWVGGLMNKWKDGWTDGCTDGGWFDKPTGKWTDKWADLLTLKNQDGL